MCCLRKLAGSCVFLDVWGACECSFLLFAAYHSLAFFPSVPFLRGLIVRRRSCNLDPSMWGFGFTTLSLFCLCNCILVTCDIPPTSCAVTIVHIFHSFTHSPVRTPGEHGGFLETYFTFPAGLALAKYGYPRVMMCGMLVGLVGYLIPSYCAAPRVPRRSRRCLLASFLAVTRFHLLQLFPFAWLLTDALFVSVCLCRFGRGGNVYFGTRS